MFTGYYPFKIINMQLKIFLKIILFAVLLLTHSCELKKMEKEKSFDAKNMDMSVNPGQDFFTYANGNWLKENPVPDEYSVYGAFVQLQERNQKDLKTIFEEVAKQNKAINGTKEQKIRDFYSSGMDTNLIEQNGLSVIKDELEDINKLSTFGELMTKLAHLHSIQMNPLFNIYVGQDQKNSEKYIINLVQGGLGLPDRDYYLNDDERSKEIRDEYKSHLKKIFSLININNNEIPDVIFELEKKLASHSHTRLERRDPYKNYNKLSLDELSKIVAKVNWESYFRNIGIEIEVQELNVAQLKFFESFNTLFDEIPLEDWKIYFKWHLLYNTCTYLSKDFEIAHFEFYGKRLSGKETMRPRYKRVISAADKVISELIGQLYVEKYFPPEAKAKMIDLVSNLKVSLKERIQNLEWMGEETKKEALAKLDLMNIKIGYPDKWKDYSSLSIVRDSYIKNIIEGNKFGFNYNISKLGKPVDHDEWFMPPQMVNAYYHPLLNEIVFPAAILQPPFFSLYEDDAINYGAIGVVIGHEMTHGFDDQGRQYTKEGNLENWWSKEDEERFKDRTKLLIDQYNSFILFDSLNMGINGELTLGENIADVGGLIVAYNALLKALNNGTEPDDIDGFNYKQRFFLSYANIWRSNIREKELMRRLKEDVHSPAKYRVNGALFNIPEFYESFAIDTADILYLSEEKRCKVW